MFENICMMRCERNGWAAGQSPVVKIMHGHAYKKYNTLCSPTSALEKKQMLSRLGEELN
jgi:hypothetical protein